MRKDFLLMFVVALGSGLLGGFCSGILFGNTPALGQDNVMPLVNIRAQKFELVDKEGTVRGRFFLKEDGYPILRVGDFEEDSIALNLSKKGPALILTKPSEALYHRDIVLAVSESGSRISFYQGDSGMELYANDQAAKILISSHSPGVVLEGPYNLPASPGMALNINSGGANLSLYDAEGKRRMVLGSALLENPKTGVETSYPLSSLVFFKEDGEVLWNAP